MGGSRFTYKGESSFQTIVKRVSDHRQQSSHHNTIPRRVVDFIYSCAIRELMSIHSKDNMDQVSVANLLTLISQLLAARG